MFSLNKCLARACNNIAVSTINEKGEITEDKNYCIDHSPNPGKLHQDIINYINTHDKIVGLCANGLTFSNMDFSGKKFYGCYFRRCTFTNVHSKGIRSRMSVFDFAVFTDCNIIESNIHFTSFAGCTFSRTLFTASELLQNNYNGINAVQSSFDDSDLYNSRFINSTLVNISFRNCNLKKVLFHGIKQENVSFKMSNTREAAFDQNGSELTKDIANFSGQSEIGDVL